MADIVSSLFGLSPIRQEAEMAARARDLDIGTLIGQATTTGFMTPIQSQNYINRQAAQAALGGTAVRALGGLFGLQDPMLQRATQLESILGETQAELGEMANDPTQFYPTLQNKLANAGFTREAMMAGQAGQKAMQEWNLSQAKLLTEQAQYAKATQEKLGAFGQTLLAAGIKPGTDKWNEAMKAKIEKETYIPEKTVSPENKAEAVKLGQFVKEFGEEEGSTKFLVWKNQLEQKKSAVQGTGAILSDSGKTIGAYDEKGGFTTAKGEVIPKEQMIDYRTSQDASLNFLNLMSNITEQDIDNAFGSLDTTQGGVAGTALKFGSNQKVVDAQTKINELGVKQVLTNLQQLKGASSDREMSRMASTFPGFEAKPEVMKKWLARAVLTTFNFLNKNKEKYGFDAPPVNITQLGNNPLVRTLPATERAALIEQLAKYDAEFKALPEKEKIKVLNSLMSDGKVKTKKQTRTTKSGVTYTIEE